MLYFVILQWLLFYILRHIAMGLLVLIECKAQLYTYIAILVALHLCKGCFDKVDKQAGPLHRRPVAIEGFQLAEVMIYPNYFRQGGKQVGEGRC